MSAGENRAGQGPLPMSWERDRASAARIAQVGVACLVHDEIHPGPSATRVRRISPRRRRLDFVAFGPVDGLPSSLNRNEGRIGTIHPSPPAAPLPEPLTCKGS